MPESQCGQCHHPESQTAYCQSAVKRKDVGQSASSRCSAVTAKWARTGTQTPVLPILTETSLDPQQRFRLTSFHAYRLPPLPAKTHRRSVNREAPAGAWVFDSGCGVFLMTTSSGAPRHPLYAFSSLASSSESVASAGRIHGLRRHARVVFVELYHRGSRCQAAVRQDSPLWAEAQSWAAGDWVEGSGPIAPSRTGEPTWWLETGSVRSRARRPLEAEAEGRPLPEQAWLRAPETVQRALLRPRMLAAVRAAFHADNFVEVETPVLQSTASGASARPFVTRARAWDRECVLRVAPEPALIRLLVGGFDRVFEVARCFRNEGVSPRHHPEFTLLEAYEAFAPLETTLDRLDALWSVGFRAAGLDPAAVPFRGHLLDFTRVRRATLRDLVSGAWGTDDPSVLADRVAAATGRRPVSDAEAWLQAFEHRVEETLVVPTAVLDWPEEVSPLAHATGGWARRFEVFAGGMELANGYEQETDPDRQRTRFAAQAAALGHGADLMPADAAYLEAMEWGMPPLSGFGVGVDRWVLFALDGAHLRDAALLV